MVGMMSLHLRLASRSYLSPCLSTCPSSSFRRGFSSSRPRCTALETDNGDDRVMTPEEEAEALRDKKRMAVKELMHFNENIEKYRLADRPNKWLKQAYVDGEVQLVNANKVDGPFPMNPTFRPPSPISDAQRTEMYNAFMEDPLENSVRALSERFHISLQRVDAILRLKGLEASWVKFIITRASLVDKPFLDFANIQTGRPIQKSFNDQMELSLGVFSRTPEQPTAKEIRKGRKPPKEDPNIDSAKADFLEQEEKRDAARQRYQHLYWETVPEEGGEPVLPGALEHALEDRRQILEAAEKEKSSTKYMQPTAETTDIKRPMKKVRILKRPGHVPIKIVDVAGKFLDVKEHTHRTNESERRERSKLRQNMVKKEIEREMIRVSKSRAEPPHTHLHKRP